MVEFLKKYGPFFLSLCILIGVWSISLFDFFFWDTVQLASKQAHFFYDGNFSSLLLPQEIDSGHLPFFGMYLASIWVLFGKSLFVSHFAILPWLILLSWALFKLSSMVFEDYRRYWVLLFCVLDPTLLAQTTLVSPDVVLIAAFFGALVFYFNQKPVLLAVLISILSIVSMRGFILVCVLFIFHFFYGRRVGNTILYKKQLISFILGMILSILYFGYHYVMKDWVGFHQQSPWSESFAMVDFLGYIKNALTFLWRMVDFGRIFIMLGFVLFLIHPKVKKSIVERPWIILLILLSITFISVTIAFESLTAHRYYLPLYLVVSFLFGRLLWQSSFSNKLKEIVSVIIIIGLLSGHFWIYPNQIAQGWDASLAHRPFFELYRKTESYLEQQKIDKIEVATFFPLLAAEKYLKLNDQTVSFVDWFQNSTSYLLLSNIFNDAPDALFLEYTKKDALYFQQKNGIWVGLFKRKKGF